MGKVGNSYTSKGVRGLLVTITKGVTSTTIYDSFRGGFYALVGVHGIGVQVGGLCVNTILSVAYNSFTFTTYFSVGNFLTFVVCFGGGVFGVRGGLNCVFFGVESD